jgi:hypothetical protein
LIDSSNIFKEVLECNMDDNVKENTFKDYLLSR